MQFDAPLIKGRLIARYKRFLADVELVGDHGAAEVVTAHCANPGSMMGLIAPGAEVWLSPARSAGRKLPFTWELVRVGRSLVGVRPALANRLASDAIARGRIPELAGYAALRREVRTGASSRIDLHLSDPDGGEAHVEVKSVSLRRPPSRTAEFPDAVTARGSRHLDALAAIARAGGRAVMLYVAQRADCRRFALAEDIDPGYAAAFRVARAAGVEAYCYACTVSRTGIRIARPLPIDEPGAGPA